MISLGKAETKFYDVTDATLLSLGYGLYSFSYGTINSIDIKNTSLIA